MCLNRLATRRLPIHPFKARLLVNSQQCRNLDLQEYQSKQILQENGVHVQRFKVVSDDKQIDQVLFPNRYGTLPKSRWSGFDDDISCVDEFVVKAQILAGGRGKGIFKKSGLLGGVKLTSDPNQASLFAKSMLQDYLITKQTTSEGVLVQRVMIAEAVTLKKEFYLAIVLDRSYDKGPILIGSPMGGMEIEEIAQKDDKAIRKFTIPIDTELDQETATKIAIMAFDLQVSDSDLILQCANEIMKLYDLFLKLDANQIEINPLGVTNKRQVICVDSKIKFDENAKFRQNWLDEIEKTNQIELNKRDCAAREQNLNYIGLEGSIGCLVNGAGLAMATMDIIKLHGGEPANFLDIGGGASDKQTLEALRIISSDASVKTILINIFGGITRCDSIAKGIIKAMDELRLDVPIVCRLQGTEVEAAQKMLQSSNLVIHTTEDLDDAARLAVKLSLQR